LRNVAKLFAHLLANDAISWGVLGCIRLTEDDTTSSSRIFIKYLFQVRVGGWGRSEGPGVTLVSVLIRPCGTSIVMVLTQSDLGQ
jgi:hypothetical protein